MRRAAVLGVGCALVACSLQTYAVVQPRFQTKEAHGAFERMVAAVQEHCDGVASSNPDGLAVIGRWQLWNAGDGVTLSQCLVTLFPDESGSEHLGEVRITFVVRKCPVSDVSDLEALAPTCERAEVVSQTVSNALAEVAKRLEASIRR